MHADGTIRRAAVLGHPIAHSLSPVLHRTAYAELGLDWRYEAIDVAAAELPEFFEGLGPEWVGLSLTMPLKEAVLPLLDDVSPDASQVRAANTVVFDDAGRHGFNTDITGLVGLLTAAGVGGKAVGAVGSETSEGEDLDAVVLGSGATARSAVAALAHCEVREVSVVARRPDAAGEVAALARELGLATTLAAWPPQATELGAAVVVNTVPGAAIADFELPQSPGLLVDVLYDPWPTPLASRWTDAGGAVVGGLELLVRQAVEQVALFTGRRPDISAMREAGERTLDEHTLDQR